MSWLRIALALSPFIVFDVIATIRKHTTNNTKQGASK
jgi:hypothetical protein